MVLVGKQTEGSSASSLKKIALDVFKKINPPMSASVIDIGAGRGELSHLLSPLVNNITLVDDWESMEKPSNATFVRLDLNQHWTLLSDNSFDTVFSLEVIEHIENPRHFIREVKRILKPGGYAFITTPNNTNLFSRLNFLLTGCHRYFQDSCYPAHISPLCKIDITRILLENELTIVDFFYNYEDSIPKINIPLRIHSPLFANSIGVLFLK